MPSLPSQPFSASNLLALQGPMPWRGHDSAHFHRLGEAAKVFFDRSTHQRSDVPPIYPDLHSNDVRQDISAPNVSNIPLLAEEVVRFRQ